VIHFFSFTGRKEMNKSAIATMLNSSNAPWYIKKLSRKDAKCFIEFHAEALRAQRIIFTIDHSQFTFQGM
jgi:hypothetical protein